MQAGIQAMKQEGRKLGEFLVGGGHLDRAEMLAAVRENVRAKVLEVFRWEAGEFRVSAYRPPPAELPGEAFPVPRVLWDAVHDPLPVERMRALLDTQRRRPVWSRRPLSQLPVEVALNAADLSCLRRLRAADGEPLERALERAGGDRDLRFLYYLLLQGYLALGEAGGAGPRARPLPPDAARKVRCARLRLEAARRHNHFQVLGVPLDGDDGCVRDAYRRKAKEVHPDTLGTDDPAELHSIYGDLFQRIRSAYEGLRSRELRRDYVRQVQEGEGDAAVSSGDEVLRAEVHFQEGKVYLKHRNWERAADAFSRALAVNPEEGEYALGLGIARMHQVAAGRRERYEEAEALLRKARERLPDSGEPDHYLGRLAATRGRWERAAACYRGALQRDPGHREAARELRVLRARAG